MKMLEIYNDKVIGSISGLDRIRFRGTIRWLANELGIRSFLGRSNILLKDFEKWATDKTKFITQSCNQQASILGIKTIYLRTGAIDKEKYVRQYADENNIKNGPICMLSVVEPCISPKISSNKETKKLEIHMITRKCKKIYLYFDDPDFGFGHVRLQTWLPMNIFINLNGRHWLEKQLIKNNIAYIKDRNSFPWIEDLDSAQKLLIDQLKTNWNSFLYNISLSLCPDLNDIFNPLKMDYYWSADDTEWATDIMFKSKSELDKIYPSLLNYGMSISDSKSVLRYLGKSKITVSGKIQGILPNEIMSECRKRFEGMRLKHWVNSNSVKMYNKSGNLLRFETTITKTREFKVFRKPENDDTKPESWLKMRKGVADIHRRCQISQQSNNRYADSISAAKIKNTIKEVTVDTCRRISKKGKNYRALNPWNMEDFKLLLFLVKGALSINGFKNKDFREHLFGSTDKMNDKDKQYFSGKATRYIRLLRGHGLIRKVPKLNRYVLTEKGRTFSSSLVAVSSVDIEKLMEIAI